MSTIKFLKTPERFIGPLFWSLVQQRILNERVTLKINANPFLKIICIYVYSTWMQVYYDLFQCWVQYRVGFTFLRCIYVDVCLWNVNQYYRKN